MAQNSNTTIPAVQHSGSILPDAIDGRHTYAWERVLIYLARMGGDSPGAVVSKCEVAEVLSLNPNTVDYAVTLLRRRGLIESAPRYAPDGGCLANEYRLTREGALESARVMMRAFGKKPAAAATA